jgi:hypothetical protein
MDFTALYAILASLADEATRKSSDMLGRRYEGLAARISQLSTDRFLSLSGIRSYALNFRGLLDLTRVIGGGDRAPGEEPKVTATLITDGREGKIERLVLTVTVTFAVPSLQSSVVASRDVSGLLLDDAHVLWAQGEMSSLVRADDILAAIVKKTHDVYGILVHAQTERSLSDFDLSEKLAEELEAQYRPILSSLVAADLSEKNLKPHFPRMRSHVDKGTTKSFYYKVEVAGRGGDALFEFSLTDHPKTDQQMASQRAREDVRFIYVHPLIRDQGVPFLNPYPNNKETRISRASRVEDIRDHLADNAPDYKPLVKSRLPRDREPL